MNHEQKTLCANELGSVHSMDARTIRERNMYASPTIPSLGSSGCQHGQFLAHSEEPADAATQAPSSTTAQELDLLRDPRDAVFEGNSEHSVKGQLGSLGSIASSSDHAVCLAEEPRHHLLRISETVTLFNSTPIGRVLNERQLLRHRISANHTFVVGNTRHSSARIDVMRYVAWLTDRLHADTDGHPVVPDCFSSFFQVIS
jgi:hypothetical protein